MDLITRTSYAKDFVKTFKQYFEGDHYNGFEMDCADMFRHDEWKVIDLFKIAGNDESFKHFVTNVIECMKYNRSMEMD
jgi:hypothetical protein